ncbi:MAG: LPS assembly protein LptD, partial [Gammaproteobacteria bacterium]|nr:LPS assembly protein LptD [Gammaproteobacteria bacterium]
DRRQSGFLFPGFKNSEKNGLDVQLPFYWNIAPSIDATFTPRHLEKRGDQLGVELRWLTQKSYSEFYTEMMENDVQRQSLLQSLEPVQSNENVERWFAKFNHQTVFNENWRFDINGQKASDKEYFRDFGGGFSSSNQRQISSKASLNYQDDVWLINLFALSNQSLIGRNDYRYMPSLNVQADKLTDSGLRFELDAELTQFEHENVFRTVGERQHARYSISYPMENSWSYLIPKASYDVTKYQQESQITEETFEYERKLPITSLETGVFFDRQVNWFGKDITHSLSPSIFYSNIPYRQQYLINLFDTSEPDLSFDQLLRANRFAGIDRIGDEKQVSFILGNQIVDNKSGREMLNFRFGRRYYLEDRIIQLNGELLDSKESSPWLSEFSLNLNKSLTMDGYLEWDQTINKINQSRSRIKFEPKPNHIVNLSHRYRSLAGYANEEADFSVSWPVNERWRFVARWYGDMQNDQVIESFAGLEYESCCWAIRVVGQKYLNIQLDSTGTPITIGADPYNDGISIQFVFKGFGSAGESGISDMLESGIRGYQDPFAK